MLTLEHLNAVDRDALAAPAGWLLRQASDIRAGLHELDGELLQFAQALLIKLEHLESNDRALPADDAEPVYLAPGLIPPAALLPAAA